MEPITLGVSALTLIFSAGAAWGGAKSALNGTRTRVSDLHRELERHTEKDDKVQKELLQRTSSIEAKIDVLMSERRR